MGPEKKIGKIATRAPPYTAVWYGFKRMFREDMLGEGFHGGEVFRG